MRVVTTARPRVSVTDRIVLTMPSDDGYRAVGTLVLGGIGARVELPYERMDDLQLALLSMLEASLDGEVTLEVDAGQDGLRLAVGPLRDGSHADDGLTLVLSRLADEVEYERRDGQEWVALLLRATR